MEESEKKSLFPKNEGIKVTSFIQPTLNVKDVLGTRSNPTFLNVFCLELQPSSTAEEDDDAEPHVLYCHPTDGNPLRGAEGMFVVLSHASEDLTGEPVKCTILHSDRGLTFRVAYFKEGQNLLAFAVRKETVSCHEVCSLMTAVVQLIHFLYGSLNSAFCRKKCRRKLAKIFVSVEEILSQNNGKLLMPFFNYIPFLPLPKVVELRIEEILGHLGIGDFPRPESQNILSRQRKLLDLVGCCLFFKGYLLSSHLTPKILQDVYLYLKFNQLLEFHDLENTQQIVLWREIFPTKNQDQKEIPFGYHEPECRHFLQIVSLGNKTLCVLLQVPKVKVDSTTKKLGPPLFYTEQLKNILQKLESLIPEIVEKSEMSSKEKSISNFSNLQSSLRQQFASWLKTSSTPFSNPTSFSDKNEISKDLRIFNLTSQSTNLSDTVASHSGILTPNTRIGNTSRLVTPNLSKQRIHNFLPMLKTEEFQNVLKSETLPNIFEIPEGSKGLPIQKLSPRFHGIVVVLYLQSDQENVEKGVRINGSVRSTPDLLSDFNRCCARIKEHFDSQLNRPESDQEALTQSPRINEYGVLFRQKSKEERKGEGQDYWVVGRRLKQGPHVEQRIFLCYLDGTPQNLVELTFRLSFGHNWIC